MSEIENPRKTGDDGRPHSRPLDDRAGAGSTGRPASRAAARRVEVADFVIEWAEK
jgi:hypothetical protein